jgi:hypothetical protein
VCGYYKFTEGKRPLVGFEGYVMEAGTTPLHNPPIICNWLLFLNSLQMET